MISELHRVSDIVDGVPRSNDMSDIGKYSATVYESRFDSWTGALDEAGFEHDRDYKGAPSHKLTKQELIDDIQRLKNELDRVPTASDVSEHGKHSTTTYYNKFDSWEDVIEGAGYDYNYNNNNLIGGDKDRLFSDDELLDELRRLKEQIGKVPTIGDMNEKGEYSSSTYQRYFGSWNDAIEEAGFETRKSRRKLDEDEIRFYKYGNGWRSKCRSVREKYDYKCRNCGMSNEEHKEKYNKSLEVHHLININLFLSEFTEDEQEKLSSDYPPVELKREADEMKNLANQIENLVPLCTSCHYTVEN